MKKLEVAIKELRDDMRLTQEQLAEKSGLSRGYISRLESGDYKDDSPSIRTLQKIAEGLSIPLEIILKKAGITKEDYTKIDTRTHLRAKYNFNSDQIKEIEQHIAYVKNKLKS